MTDKELRKLKRADLLEILLVQSREIDRLKAELKKAKQELAKQTPATEDDIWAREAARIYAKHLEDKS